MSPEPTAVVFRPAPITSGVAGASSGTSGPASGVPSGLPSGPVGPAGRDDDERRTAGYAAGYAAGWAAGARAAAEAAEQAERRRAAAAAEAEVRRDAALAQAVTTLHDAAAAATARQAVDAVALAAAVHAAALELAEAVLGHELRPGPDAARALLARALTLPADERLHTLRVSPADLAHLEAVVAERAASLPDGVRLVADPSLQPGDVVAEHAAVVLDVRVRSALARARAALEDE